MNSRLLALVLLTFVIGCDHEPPTVSTTQPQLSQFTERALAALRSKESIRMPNGNSDVVVGDYDATKPIRYEFQAGKASRIIVQIPIKTSKGHSYTEFIFDPSSGMIKGVYNLIE